MSESKLELCLVQDTCFWLFQVAEKPKQAHEREENMFLAREVLIALRLFIPVHAF